MQSQAQTKYEKAKIGDRVTLSPSAPGEGTMRAFQTVVNEVRQLERDGLVEVTDTHTSSDYGFGWLDCIEFIKQK